MQKQEELLVILAQNGKIDYSEAQNILEQAKKENKKAEDILLKKKIINSNELNELKAKIYNLKLIDLTEKEIDEKIINIIPKEVSENYKIICFNKENNKIQIGIIDPENFKAIEAVNFLAKDNDLIVEYFLISSKSFKVAFKKYKTLNKELNAALKTRAEEEENLITVDDRDRMELKQVTKSAPVAKIVSVIIRHAVEGEASDIHIEPSRQESRIRYRIDGILHTSLVLPRSVHPAIVARIKVMANLKLDETRIPQDGRIRLIINDREIDFRISILPLVGAEKVVMRILDTTKGAPKLNELGFQGEQLEIINNNIKKTEGMLLITGPTGSGKSTTLFSIIEELNNDDVNISTLEDPVEYQIKGVNQSQVKPSIGYTFSSGLRSFFRQDPDIIMVGEIRDEETAELATHAALTGHFVLSTLHTTSAIGAIPRLVDMKIEPFLLGSTLHTVIAQRLARKICEHCKEKIEVPKIYKEKSKKYIEKISVSYIKKIIKDFDVNNFCFYKGKGCPKCGNTGYKGRLSICEVLDINGKIKEIILGGKKHISIEDVQKSQKFITINQDGFIKIIQGLTTIEEMSRILKD